MFDFAPHSRDVSPHGRDALTRAHARFRADVEFLIGEGIAHAKAAKAAKVGKGFEMSECVNVRMSECRFVVASLVRGGISETA